MFYVYLIKDRYGKMYTGYTMDLKKRLQRHAQGYTPYLNNRRPVKLIYYEAYLSKKDARLREKSLKSYGSVYTGLKQRIKYSLSLC
ncbi:MAG: GIY-YIG nuclease family protein [Candidatus Magasanikbacteria bacterium]|nr:GIY-YIG nuclease family protein [Candidatus Magasanikbacteria bacterium]